MALLTSGSQSIQDKDNPDRKIKVYSNGSIDVNTTITSVTINNHPGKYFSYHLKLDGTGNWSMMVDGSIINKNFYRGPTSGKKWYVSLMKITLEDASNSHDKFGGIPGGLTNGVIFKVTESGTERDLYEHSFKKTGTFYHAVTDVIFESSNTDIFSVEWSFAKAGSYIELKGSTADNLKCIVRDDLTTLDFMEVTIFGYEVDE